MGKIKADVDTVILKSLVAAQSDIGRQPNSFELFGYDVFIDDRLRPCLIDFNSSPSTAQENLLDSKVKTKLIADTVRLVDPQLRSCSPRAARAPRPRASCSPRVARALPPSQPR